jgi:hypothetical protein
VVCRSPRRYYRPPFSGPLAQRSELSAHNRLVPGSNPGGPTEFSPAMSRTSALLNPGLRAFEPSAGTTAGRKEPDLRLTPLNPAVQAGWLVPHLSDLIFNRVEGASVPVWFSAAQPESPRRPTQAESVRSQVSVTRTCGRQHLLDSLSHRAHRRSRLTLADPVHERGELGVSVALGHRRPIW